MTKVRRRGQFPSSLYSSALDHMVCDCSQTRKRVLINAFTVRALRDTFPPARGAGEIMYLSLHIKTHPLFKFKVYIEHV